MRVRNCPAVLIGVKRPDSLRIFSHVFHVHCNTPHQPQKLYRITHWPSAAAAVWQSSELGLHTADVGGSAEGGVDLHRPVKASPRLALIAEAHEFFSGRL